MKKSRYIAPTVNAHVIHSADQAKGVAAEICFRTWLDTDVLSQLYIDQTLANSR